MNGMPMMHMTVPAEIRAHFLNYIKTHPQLKQPEIDMLQGYAEGDTIMYIMAWTYFRQWEDVRNFTVESWTLNVIEELLSIMEVIE